MWYELGYVVRKNNLQNANNGVGIIFMEVTDMNGATLNAVNCIVKWGEK